MQPRLPNTDCVRWRPGGGGHVESFFLKANNPQRPDQAFWIKFTILDPGSADAVAEVWAIRFSGTGGPHRAAKGTYRADDCQFSNDLLKIEAGDSSLQAGRTSGSLGAGEDCIRWDLEFDYEGQQVMYGLPYRWMYGASLPRNKVYTSCPTTRFRGTVSCGEEVWQVGNWPGMLGHNWGASHNPRYHWAQCNLFDDGDCIFEGFSARIRLGTGLSPWLTAAVVRFEGQELPFNGITGVLNRSVKADLFSWSFLAQQGGWRLQWQVEAPQDDFAGLTYTNPDGSDNFCLNSKIANCRLQLARREAGNWREVADLRGKHSCAYEILVQDPDHGVAILA